MYLHVGVSDCANIISLVCIRKCNPKHCKVDLALTFLASTAFGFGLAWPQSQSKPNQSMLHIHTYSSLDDGNGNRIINHLALHRIYIIVISSDKTTQSRIELQSPAPCLSECRCIQRYTKKRDNRDDEMQFVAGNSISRSL